MNLQFCSRIIVLFLGLIIGQKGQVLAQSMIQSAEWCAEGRKVQHPFLPPQPDYRSDSVDILHTQVLLNIMLAPQLSGNCRLTLKAKATGIKTIMLDLEKLVADSVFLNGSSVPFTQNGVSLRAVFPNALPQATNSELRVVYKGQPKLDDSGWGGVYNTSGYTFNLGVGFAADPHSFGRAWIPCFDNFVERSTYEVTIVSPVGKPGYSNGKLVSEKTQGNQLIRTWRIDESIPSYLACFSAGPYSSWKRQVQGTNGPIPVEIAANASDTNKVRATFANLEKAVKAYEYWFGPYLWNKIGYSLVPFGSGAMEHATNIAIMRSAIDGSLGFETLWAHELSHHWWGDLATCSTAEDMWLNEGWAVYSEHLFTEWVYGKASFIKAVRDNFLSVLQTAHINESGYRSVSGVTHDITYGTHTYNKGAVVAHNMRGYLGDSLFRKGVREALAATRYDDWSSAEFNQKMSAATGVDMTAFFEGWVFNGGFPHFSVDSFQNLEIGPANTTRVFLRQKLRGANTLFKNVPLELTFVNDKHERIHRTIMADGANTIANVVLPFKPKFVWVNTNWKLTLAMADREKLMTAIGPFNDTDTKINITVSSLPDSALIRVEHNFVTPDNQPEINPNRFKLSNRYWTVYMDAPSGMVASCTLYYDGKGKMDQLDAELFAQTSPSEDSLVLLYRSGAGQPWLEHPAYVKNKLGSNTDRFGFVRVDNLKPGQYTFAKGVSKLSTHNGQLLEAKISPNPAFDSLRLVADDTFDKVELFDASGKMLRNWSFEQVEQADLSLEGLPSGLYWLYFTGKKGYGSANVIKK